MAHPGGRPTDYTSEMPDKLLKAMTNGLSVKRFCKSIDICTKTFYTWTQKHPEFLCAFEKAKEYCEVFWEEWLIERLDNKDVNTGLVKLYMTNRFGWTTEKKESTSDLNVSESPRKVREADDQYK